MRRTNNMEERSPSSSTGHLTCGEIGQGAQTLIRALAEAKIDDCGHAEDEAAWEAAVKRAMASIPRLLSCCPSRGLSLRTRVHICHQAGGSLQPLYKRHQQGMRWRWER